MRWKKNRGSEIPGHESLFFKALGASLDVYPTKKRFGWEVELGDLYAHGKVKSRKRAKKKAQNELRKILLLTVQRLDSVRLRK